MELWKLLTNLNSELVEFLQSSTFARLSFFLSFQSTFVFAMTTSSNENWKPFKYPACQYMLLFGCSAKRFSLPSFSFLGNFKHSSFIKSWLSLNGTMYPGVIFYRNLSSSFPSRPASRHYLRKAEVRCREKYKTSFEFSGK